MNFSVYVLRSMKDGQRYIGCTEDVDARLKRHNSGRVSATKNRRPLALIYVENYATWSEARRREDFFKSGVGRSWLKEKGF